MFVSQSRQDRLTVMARHKDRLQPGIAQFMPREVTKYKPVFISSLKISSIFPGKRQHLKGPGSGAANSRKDRSRRQRRAQGGQGRAHHAREKSQATQPCARR